ncbi:MAG: nucleotidyltransferase domain-containing protein [Anaerolineales bacterium]|nr:nucleotidyltransferase domain-containing protein [Anaerolineales bacterium]MDW8445756.1 nucleotidyltransferase domain-containing protein [Anaerolineales bacterium]
MLQALKEWAAKAKAENTDLLQVGYFGSYACGDWGVGSDLDVVLILAHSDLPFEWRAAQFDLTGLPVPVDVLVYTRAE